MTTFLFNEDQDPEAAAAAELLGLSLPSGGAAFLSSLQIEALVKEATACANIKRSPPAEILKAVSRMKDGVKHAVLFVVGPRGVLMDTCIKDVVAYWGPEATMDAAKAAVAAMADGALEYYATDLERKASRMQAIAKQARLGTATKLVSAYDIVYSSY